MRKLLITLNAIREPRAWILQTSPSRPSARVETAAPERCAEQCADSARRLCCHL